MAPGDFLILVVVCTGIIALLLPLLGDVHPILTKIAGWEYDLIGWIIRRLPGR